MYLGVQVGIEEEGLTDVMSGLLSGSFSLGGGAGPILGGVLAAWFGFQWAAATFGLLQLAMALAVAVVSVRVAHTARSAQELVQEAAAEIIVEQQNGSGGVFQARPTSGMGGRKERPKDVVTPRRPGSGRRSGQWQGGGDDAHRQPLLAPSMGPEDNA